MANIAVCSNSITALITADASYKSLCLSLIWASWYQGQSLQTIKYTNIENVCGINGRKLPNVVSTPVMGCITVYREYLQYMFNYTTPLSSFLLPYIFNSKNMNKIMIDLEKGRNMKLKILHLVLNQKHGYIFLREGGRSKPALKKCDVTEITWHEMLAACLFLLSLHEFKARLPLWLQYYDAFIFLLNLPESIRIQCLSFATVITWDGAQPS